jgi:PBP1b-binding outer membrane lipoprotein LpoB
MKKIYIIFLICICFFFLSSCSNSEDTMIEDSYTETDENNDKETEEDYDKET